MKDEHTTKVELLENQKQDAIRKINIDEVEDLKSDNQSLSKQLKDALAKIVELTTDMKKINQDFVELQQIASHKTSENVGKDETISVLQKQLYEKTKIFDKLKTDTTNEITLLKERLSNLENENTQFSIKLFSAEKQQQKAEDTLKIRIQEYSDLEQNLKTKMDVLENRLERQGIVSKDEIKEANIKIENMKLIINESNISKQHFIDENNSLNLQIKMLQKKLDDHNSFMEAVISNTKKILKLYDPIYSNLSCLSCLEFLQSPLMLICGHSICMNCFNQHSDPKSKDSIVFCEECKIETKNKELMESKVIEVFCEKFSTSKKFINDILNLAVQFSQNVK